MPEHPKQADMPEHPKQADILTPWFQECTLRFDEERAALEAMGFVLDEDILKTESKVLFTGALNSYPDRNLRIEYPWAFPSIAPIVVDDGSCSLLPRHQRAGSRIYCLFGPEGKEWYAALTGVDVLHEVERLLNDVLSGDVRNPQIEDPYPEPYSAQAVFVDHGIILIPPVVSDYLPADLNEAADGEIRIRYPAGKSNNKLQRGLVIHAHYRHNQGAAECSQGYKRLVNESESRGRLTYIPSLKKPIQNGEDLEELLLEFGLTPSGNSRWHAVVFSEESGNRAAKRYSWLVFKKINMKMCPVRTITHRLEDKSVRIPGLEFMHDKKIALIGCGSIGSKFAVAMVASGAFRFLLVDRECIEPDNSIRHECGVEYFGWPKAHALALRMRSINPDLECDLVAGDPFSGGCQKLTKGFLTGLQECDLIVNATGHDGISRIINQYSESLGIPSLHVSVTNGAWSGEIIRYIPYKTACWLCYQDAYDKKIPPGEKVPNNHVFGPGCDQPTFTGTTYDVGIVASMAAGFAVDTLRIINGSSSVYDGDYLLWEGRDDDKLLQKSTVKSFEPRDCCSVCGNQT